MEENNNKNCNLKKWKSTSSLLGDEHTLQPVHYRSCRKLSESSIEVYVINDSDSDDVNDSGFLSRIPNDKMGVLEQKVDKLNDLFREQCSLLSSIKDKIHISKMKKDIVGDEEEFFAELVSRAIAQSSRKPLTDIDVSSSIETHSTQGQTLLAAIESPPFSLERAVREALTDFLNSEELLEHMISATAECVRDTVHSCLSRELAAACAPTIHRAHRQLARHLTATLDDAFANLMENGFQFSKTVNNATFSLRRALEKHQALLERIGKTDNPNITKLVEKILQEELQQWRHKMLDILSSETQSAVSLPDSYQCLSPAIDYIPSSPAQPADPDTSIIDQLMQAAVIQKMMNDGDVNGAFSHALSSRQLRLVVVACRAAPPRLRLEPPVLLALAQQLATDMLHDTTLKCRYLEEAITSLDPRDPGTRPHLPVVVGEVRRHLTMFLRSYPGHVSARRIALIIMAADNLLK